MRGIKRRERVRRKGKAKEKRIEETLKERE